MELKKGKERKRETKHVHTNAFTLHNLIYKQKKNLPAEMSTRSHEPRIPAVHGRQQQLPRVVQRRPITFTHTFTVTFTSSPLTTLTPTSDGDHDNDGGSRAFYWYVF